MKENRPDINDPEFLVSRSLDDDLTEAERRVLKDGLADDPVLRRLADEYQEIDTWVRSLRSTAPELDWERFACQVRRRCEASPARTGWAPVRRLYVPLAAAAALAIVWAASLMYSTEPSVSTLPVPTVLARVTAPPRLSEDLLARQTVTVRFNRAPPPGLVGPAPPSRSIVIAAAGAEAFTSTGTAPDAAPYF